MIKMAWNEFAARRLIVTGKFGLITVKVTTAGRNVPGVNGGIVTTAFVELTRVRDCNPLPASIESTVIVPEPLVTVKAPRPPGKEFPGASVPR